MPRIVFTSSAAVVGMPKGQLIDFAVVEDPSYAEVSRVAHVHDDMLYDVVTTGLTSNDFEIVPSNISGAESFTVESATPLVASANAGRVSWESDGQAEILVSAPGRGKRRMYRDMAKTASGEVGDATGFAPGSLCRHCHDSIAALVSGRSPGPAAQAFVTSGVFDVDAPSISLNAGIFTGTLDFSGVSVIRDDRSDDRFPVTLISDRHGIIAKHARPPVGTRVAFRRTDGTFQVVTVAARNGVARTLSDGATVAYPDLAVVYFDAPLTGFPAYPCMPLDWVEARVPSVKQGVELTPYTRACMPYLRKAIHLPDGSVGSAIQVNYAIAGEFSTFESLPNPILTGALFGAGEYATPTAATALAGWGTKAIGGDSGGPSFFLINGELVIFSSQYAVGMTHDMAFFQSEINSIMDAQAGAPPGTYALANADLAAFTSYL